MQVTVDGVVTPVPFRRGGVAVTQIGALLHQLRSEKHGFTLSFTPHSNEFTVNLDVTMTTSTTGICGRSFFFFPLINSRHFTDPLTRIKHLLMMNRVLCPYNYV